MIKNIINTFVTKVLAAIFNLVIAIIISNYIGPEGKGQQGLIITTISLIIIISSIIGPGGLSFLLPRYNLYYLIIPSYIWSVFIITAFGFLIPFLKIVPAGYLTHVCILSVILSVSNIHNSILLSSQQIFKSNLVYTIQILTLLIVLFVLMVLLGLHSLNAYIIALYCSYFLSFLIGFYFCKEHFINNFFRFSINRILFGFRKLFKYGFYNQLDIIAQLLSFRLSYYILNNSIGEAEVGIYSNGVSIIESIWLISRSIGLVLHARIVNSRDKNYSFKLTLSFIKFSFIASFIVLLPLVFIPSQFYQFIFGQQFGYISKVILSLSPGVLFFSVSFIISYYFSGIGKHYINSIASIVGLIVTIATTLIFIPAFGIIGAGISASISYFVTTIIKIVYFVKKQNIRFLDIFPDKTDFIVLRDVLLNINNKKFFGKK